MFRRLTILEPLNQNLPLKSISQETLNTDWEVNNQPTFAVKVSKEAMLFNISYQNIYTLVNTEPTN